MCLLIDTLINAEAQKELNKDGQIEAYKFYCRRDRSLVSPFIKKIYGYPGRYAAETSNGERVFPALTPVEIGDRCVNLGIHVYLNKDQAENARKTSVMGNSVLVKVICRKEHFRAAGFFSPTNDLNAVFTEIEVTKEEFDRAVGKKSWLFRVGSVILLNNKQHEYKHLNNRVAIITMMTEESVIFSCDHTSWSCGKDYFIQNFCK